MTQKRVKASDVIGNSYYIYTLQSSNNTPSLNSTINITCNVTDVYGQAISGKSITLYQNNTSKGAKTTDSSGNASWNSISMSSAGLQVFKVENSKIEVFVDNKSDVGHTHSQYLTEHQSLSNYVTTDDSRLSDSRTPTSHTHGNLQNNGQVGSTAQANKNVVTNSSGLITTEDKPTIPSASSTTPSADTTNGSVGTGTTWARSNHTHPKSSLYAEATHNHTKSQITDFPSIPSKTSDLQNDSGFLTSHQSLSGYLQTSDVKDNLTSTDTNKPLSANQGKELKTLIDNKEDNIYRIVGTEVSSPSSSSARLHCGTLPFDSSNGKIIVYVVPDISTLSASQKALIYGSYPSGSTTSTTIKKSNNEDLTIGEIRTGDELLLMINDGYWRLIGNSSISGKEDSSNKVTSWSSTTTDIHYPSEKLVKDSLDLKSDSIHTHTIDLNSFDFYDADNWRTLEGNAPTISSNSIQANAVSSHILNKEFLKSKYYTLTFEFNTASSRNGLYLFGDMECNRKFGIVTDVGNTFVEQYDSNGNATRLYDGTKNHFTEGWHDIKVIRKGATATLYIDDELYYTFNNIGSCTNILGLWKWSMNSVTIRNVDVSLDVTELPIDNYVLQLAEKIDKEEDNFITVTNSNIWNYSDYHTADRWSDDDSSGGSITSTTLTSGSHGSYYSYNFPSNVTEISMEISSSDSNCLIELDSGSQTPISTSLTTFTATSDDGFNIDIPGRNVTVTYSITSITFNMNNWIDKIYPIGAIYISMVNVAPSTLFGGEWTALEGRFLIGQDGTSYWNGATGGSATVALTKAQMPRHNHTQEQHRHAEHGNWSTGSGSSSGYMYSSSRAVSTQYTGYATSTINHTGGTGTTNADANGSPHENMPPYIGVYMWKRIG